MPIQKYLRKTAKSAKKFVKQRYGLNKRSKGANLGQMSSDIMLLKSMVNAEKKVKTAVYPKLGVGQCAGNITGAQCLDITPLLSPGAGTDARNGASVKLCSSLFQFQFSHQALATISNKVIIEFWINKGTTLNVTSLLPFTHANAQFSGVVDANSSREQNHFSEYQLIRRVTKTIPADSISGDVSVITFDVPVSYNRGKGHHIRYGTDSGNYLTDVLNGQIFMTVRGANGNASNTTASTLDVPLTAITTGMVMRFAYKTWYYDN